MNAQQRREAELRQLARDGWPVQAETRWHWTAGDLDLWPAAGRWSNKRTGAQGRMYSTSMRELLVFHGVEDPGQEKALAASA